MFGVDRQSLLSFPVKLFQQYAKSRPHYCTCLLEITYLHCSCRQCLWWFMVLCVQRDQTTVCTSSNLPCTLGQQRILTRNCLVFLILWSDSDNKNYIRFSRTPFIQYYRNYMFRPIGPSPFLPTWWRLIGLKNVVEVIVNCRVQLNLYFDSWN